MKAEIRRLHSVCQAMRSDMNYAKQKIEEGLKVWLDGDVPEGWGQLVTPIRQAYEILG